MADVVEGATGKAEAALRCPLCEYDVRGLPEPRCPECGHGFEWEELTDPARQKLGWFFEHRRWLGGYLATQWRMLRPYKFWTVLRPSHRLDRGRMVGFGLCSVLVAILAAVLLLAADAVAYGFEITEQRKSILKYDPREPGFRGLTPRQYVDKNLPAATTWECWSRFPEYRLTSEKRSYRLYPGWGWEAAAVMLGGWAAMVAGLGLALAVVWQSRGRAAAKGSHLVRVVLYAADPTLVWLGFVAMVYLGLSQLIRFSGPNTWGWIWPSQAIAYWVPSALLGISLWSGLRFAAGVRRYLGIAHAEALALVGLVFGVILLGVYAFFTGWEWWIYLE